MPSYTVRVTVGNTALEMSKFDDDGFKIVRTKRSFKNKPTKIPSKHLLFKQEEGVTDIEEAIRRIKSAVEHLLPSQYFQDASHSVSKLLKSRSVVEIVCFGLGHIGQCNISRYQLAFLLCLKELCCVDKVLVHDPIFYTSECEVLKQLGIEIIEQNKEGSYIISNKGLTVVYLPHCPQQLTNNVLWSNWSQNLQNCLLICNSFTSIIERQPSRILSEEISYIFRIFPHTSEIVLKNNFEYSDIFNDTSIHHFSQDKIKNLDSEFWIKGVKPQYNTEELITSLIIEKLKI